MRRRCWAVWHNGLGPGARSQGTACPQGHPTEGPGPEGARGRQGLMPRHRCGGKAPCPQDKQPLYPRAQGMRGMSPLQIPAHINHPLAFPGTSGVPPQDSPLLSPRPALGPVPTEGGTARSPAPRSPRLVNCGVGGVEIRPVWAGVPESPQQIPNPRGASAQDKRRDTGSLALLGPAPSSSARCFPGRGAAGENPLALGASPPRVPGGLHARGVAVRGSPVSCSPQALVWRSWCWETSPDPTGRKGATRCPAGVRAGGAGGAWPPGCCPRALSLFSQKCG